MTYQPPQSSQEPGEQSPQSFPPRQGPPVDPAYDYASQQARSAPYVVRTEYKIALSEPTLTRALMVINALVFVIMVVYGYLSYGIWNGTEDLRVLVRFGAKVNELIVGGENWRLFTAMFIHIGPFHLLVNLYALYALGTMVERYYGHLRFLAIYVVAGLFGSLASYAFSSAISAGASGAIFGLAGAITVFFVKYRENFGAHGRAMLQNMLFIIAINIAFGLTVPGIDNWGHIGGLVGGALVAIGLVPRYSIPKTYQPAATQEIQHEERLLLSLIWVTICVGILVAGVYFVTNSIRG